MFPPLVDDIINLVGVTLNLRLDLPLQPSFLRCVSCRDGVFSLLALEKTAQRRIAVVVVRVYRDGADLNLRAADWQRVVPKIDVH